MAQMMILNPRKRGGARRKPTAKQIAARRKFAALAKARAAKLNPKKRRKKAKRRSLNLNPSPNPMAKKSKRRASRRRRSVASWLRRRRGVRRNPILPRGFMATHLQPALVGAGGAVLNDMAVGKLITFLPPSLQGAEVRHLLKGITAVGLSMLASKSRVASSGLIRQGTVGALTCVIHDAARVQLQKALPGTPLGEYLSEVIGPWQGSLSWEGPGDELGEYLSGPTFDSLSYSETEESVS